MNPRNATSNRGLVVKLPCPQYHNSSGLYTVDYTKPSPARFWHPGAGWVESYGHGHSRTRKRGLNSHNQAKWRNNKHRTQNRLECRRALMGQYTEDK